MSVGASNATALGSCRSRTRAGDRRDHASRDNTGASFQDLLTTAKMKSARAPHRRAEPIMKLRDDPAANCAMAGVLTQSNSFQLTGKIAARSRPSSIWRTSWASAAR
jgi:hypothetical protein